MNFQKMDGLLSDRAVIEDVVLMEESLMLQDWVVRIFRTQADKRDAHWWGVLIKILQESKELIEKHILMIEAIRLQASAEDKVEGRVEDLIRSLDRSWDTYLSIYEEIKKARGHQSLD